MKFLAIENAWFSGSMNYLGHARKADGSPEYEATYELNASLQISVPEFQQLVSHEVVPGHVTTFAYLQDLFVRGLVGFEASVLTMNTRAAVLFEGIANNGVLVAHGVKEPHELPDRDLEIGLLLALLQDDAKNHSSYLTWKEKLPQAEVAKTLRSEFLVSAERADKLSGAWGRHPLLGRMYLPAYRAGTELVADLRRQPRAGEGPARDVRREAASSTRRRCRGCSEADRRQGRAGRGVASRRATCRRSSPARAPSSAMRDVRQADDADDVAAVVHDDDPRLAFGRHPLLGEPQLVPVPARDEPLRHDVAGLGRERSVLRDSAHDEVAVRDDADELVLRVDDREHPDLPLAHEVGALLEGVLLPAGHDLLLHHVLDVHGRLLAAHPAPGSRDPDADRR